MNIAEVRHTAERMLPRGVALAAAVAVPLFSAGAGGPSPIGNTFGQNWPGEVRSAAGFSAMAALACGLAGVCPGGSVAPPSRSGKKGTYFAICQTPKGQEERIFIEGASRPGCTPVPYTAIMQNGEKIYRNHDGAVIDIQCNFEAEGGVSAKLYPTIIRGPAIPENCDRGTAKLHQSAQLR